MLDGNGNATNAGSHPFSTPWDSPGSKPPTNPDDFLGGIEPPTPLGGNGSRVQSSAGLNVSSAFSTGSYFLADATTAIGADLEETDITGTAGMHTDYSGSIGVNDSLSVDLQESDVLTGEYDYLSLGWSEGGSASRGLHFAYDMSLGDADLPDPTNNLTPYTQDSPPPTPASGSTAGSAPTSSSPATVTTGSATGGATDGSSGSSVSGTNNGGNSTPTLGKPVYEVDSLSTTDRASKVWVQDKVNRTTFIDPVNPGAPLTRHTVKSAVSVRIGGSLSVTAEVNSKSWLPTSGTATAKGGMNVTFLDASIDTIDNSFDTDVPVGYTLVTSEKQHVAKDSRSTSAAIDFDLELGWSLLAAPTMKGTVNISFGSKDQEMLSSYRHEKLVNNSDPTNFYETWLLQESHHLHSVTTTGGVGGEVNGLKTETIDHSYSITVENSAGTPPPPPPPPPSIATTALDYLQTGLDVAGMIPILGEGADAINAGISLGRGNYGDAAMSLAAMIPFAGAGVTAAKFGSKIGKALAKNVDKLDEVAAAGKGAVKKIQEAADTARRNCFPAGTTVATESGPKSIESIRSGERVWSHDVRTGAWMLCEVQETFERHYDGHSVLITVGDETVEATLLHPFWVVSGKSLDSRPFRDHHHTVPKDAITPGRWVDAGDLRIGDLLLLRNGERLPIRSVHIQPYHDTVYNFEVANLHNYTVGNLRILVHNDNGAEELIKLTSTQRNKLGEKLAKVADKTPRELLAGKGGLKRLQSVPGGSDVDSSLADLAARAANDDVARRTLKELKKLVPNLGLD